MKILCIIGTRPEVIKMAPVILKLKSNRLFDCLICTSSQHKELLEKPMQIFGLKADIDLDIMTENQDSFDVSVKILTKIKPVIIQLVPDLILVQGDTHTAFLGALAGFYTRVRVAHIEAGLRTYRPNEPYPEEIYRQMISRMAALHFAPTVVAKQNLLNEKIDASGIFVTGNTGIDALNYIQNNNSGVRADQNQVELSGIPDEIFSYLKKPPKNLVLVTMHRRENIKQGIANVCKAIIRLSRERDIIFVFTVHANPAVSHYVNQMLKDCKNILLTPPLPYNLFIQLMIHCSFIITDSGGIQEEAATLGKPVLVARNYSDRPESIEVSIAKLVGTKVENIYHAAIRLIDNDEERQKMTRQVKVYGDGQATERIVRILEKYVSDDKEIV